MKYFGKKIDKNLDCKQKISDIAINWNRANAILSNFRYFIDTKTLKSVNHAIFELYLYYLSQKTQINYFAKEIHADCIFSKSLC